MTDIIESATTGNRTEELAQCRLVTRWGTMRKMREEVANFFSLGALRLMRREALTWGGRTRDYTTASCCSSSCSTRGQWEPLSDPLSLSDSVFHSTISTVKHISREAKRRPKCCRDKRRLQSRKKPAECSRLSVSAFCVCVCVSSRTQWSVKCSQTGRGLRARVLSH